MLTDDEIRIILNGNKENKNIDIKSGFTWKTKSHNTLEIIKDIMAMVNTQDGGKLIIGFDEKTKAFVGNESNWFESFEQTKVMDSVNKYTSSIINLQVDKKVNFKWESKQGNLVVIDIAEFDKEPIIAKDGIDSVGTRVFSPGDIFIRTERAATEKIKDVLTARDLIHRATLKDRKNILKDIQLLLENKPVQTMPTNTKEQYLEEISDFTTTFQKPEFIPTIHQGIWKLDTMPVVKNSELIPFSNLSKIAKTSQSRHRGWPFPIITEEITKAKNSYLETFVPLDSAARNNECWRLYRDGLFCWIKSMFENETDYGGTLSKVNAIWTITEMLLFISRVYGKILSKSEEVYIRLTLTNPFERRYHDEMMSEYGNPIDTGSKCNSDIITIERTMSVLNLEMCLKEEVNKVIEELDTHFGVQEYDQAYTERFIDQILKMQMIRPEY